MSRTILVVDDERNIVELARMYLRNEGFEIEAAYNGREALEKARALQPSLVLLDIMMPEVDGLEVMRTLRKETDIPVVMLTSGDFRDAEYTSRQPQPDAFVAKSMQIEPLMNQVKALLAQGPKKSE